MIIGVSRKSNGRQFVSETERFINEAEKQSCRQTGKEMKAKLKKHEKTDS